MQRSFPSRIVSTSYGQALAAEAALPAGTLVARFEGRVVSSRDVPESEICYVLWLSDDEWLIPTSSARYANHSCSPNCRVNDDLEVVTTRAVAAGEELTFSYNTVYPGEVPPAWDDRWSFRCQCGAANCPGMVNGWVFQGDQTGAAA